MNRCPCGILNQAYSLLYWRLHGNATKKAKEIKALYRWGIRGYLFPNPCRFLCVFSWVCDCTVWAVSQSNYLKDGMVCGPQIIGIISFPPSGAFFFSSWLNMWFRYRRELFIYHSEYVTLETVSRLLTCCILDKHTANQCLAILEQVKKHRLTACLWKVWSLIRAGW